MNEIKIRSMTFFSFMSYESSTVLPLATPGLYLIDGDNRDEAEYKRSNGSGKSAIVDALAWGLYGRTVRELPDVDRVINGGSEKCYVEVLFSIDGKHYEVERCRSRAGVSLGLFGLTQFELTSPHLRYDQSEGTVLATQQKIESLLGMDFRTFCSTVVFGRASIHKFSSLESKERAQVLEKAVGADIYARAAKLAAMRKKTANVEVAEREKGLAAAELRRDAARERWRKIRKIEAVVALSEDEERRLFAARDLIGLKPKFARLLRDAERALAEQSAIVESAREAYGVATEFEEASARLYEALRRGAGGPCPTCGSTNFDREIVRAKAQRDLKAGIEARKARKDVLKKERLLLAKAGNEVALRRAALEDVRVGERTVRILEDRRRSLEERMTEDAEALRREAVATLKTEEGNVRSWESALRTAQDEAKLYDFLQQAFSPGLVSAAIEHAVPTLNEAAARAAEELTDGNLQVEFSTVAQTKGGKVIDRIDLDVRNEKGADSYGGSSEGEKAAADFVAGAAMQALHASSTKVNVVFYDEALDSLDEVAGRRVLAALRKQAREKAVFLISHVSWVRDENFDGVFRAIKMGGSSTLIRDEENRR